MVNHRIKFWLYARCQQPGCQWNHRTESYTDLARMVKEHRGVHK